MSKVKYPRATNFSRSQINRFGDALRRGDINDYNTAFDSVSKWRASHLYPLNTFRATLTKKSKVIALGRSVQPIVAQRLKRMPTIISKLIRNPEMELSRMQDVGGLRVIVGSLNEVYALKKYYNDSKLSHQLVNQKDYIVYSKDDGYRGIHLVFRYAGTNDKARAYDGMLIELQIRTRLQHTWATAVEMAGVMLGQKLKNDTGDARWLKFFKYVSKVFEIIEYVDGGEKYISLPADIDAKSLFQQIIKLDTQNDILKKLEAFSAAMNFLDSSNNVNTRHKYFLIVLDPVRMEVHITGFSKNEYRKAVEKYKELEKKNVTTSIDQVLVSAGNIKQLHIAYPNYFIDIKEFVEKIRSIEKISRV